ncbi:hypothetical protein [Limnohabitans sp. 2KL-17]|nr:hypothetical protein [Limnohabitans sp. 2KL-17]
MTLDTLMDDAALADVLRQTQQGATTLKLGDVSQAQRGMGLWQEN